jgi:hypothetical protein
MALRGLFRLCGAIAAILPLTTPVLAQGMIEGAVKQRCEEHAARLTELQGQLAELQKTSLPIPENQWRKARDVLELLNVPLAMSEFVVTADFQTEMAAAAVLFGYDWKACAFKDLRACTLGFKNKLQQQLNDSDELKFKIDSTKAQLDRVQTNMVVMGCVPAVVSPVGQWRTKYGVITFSGDHEIVGNYGASGHLKGQMQGRTLLGYWWSDVPTPVKCRTERETTNYYGNFTFEFALDGKSFRGSSGNCEADAGGTEWNGTYIGP